MRAGQQARGVVLASRKTAGKGRGAGLTKISRQGASCWPHESGQRGAAVIHSTRAFAAPGFCYCGRLLLDLYGSYLRQLYCWAT